MGIVPRLDSKGFLLDFGGFEMSMLFYEEYPTDIRRQIIQRTLEEINL